MWDSGITDGGNKCQDCQALGPPGEWGIGGSISRCQPCTVKDPNALTCISTSGIPLSW